MPVMRQVFIENPQCRLARSDNNLAHSRGKLLKINSKNGVDCSARRCGEALKSWRVLGERTPSTANASVLAVEGRAEPS